MTVLNVLSTNSIAAGASEYQTVQTGYYRVGSTAGAATVSFNGGAAITLVQNEFILIKGGKPGQAKIVKAVDDIPNIYNVNDDSYEIVEQWKLKIKIKISWKDIYNDKNQHEGFEDNRHEQSITSILRKIHGSEIIDGDETWFELFGQGESLKYPFWATRLINFIL